MRNGSYTSSTVSVCSPTLMASVDRPTGPPPNCAAQRAEDGAVDLVEAALVDAEQRQAVAGRCRRRSAPSARTSAKSRTRRSRRLAMRGVPRLRRAISHAPSSSMVHVEDAGGAGDDGLELVGVVVVEPGDEPEAVAQRPGDEAGAGGGPDEREAAAGVSRMDEAAGPLPDHDVELEVLHGRVEDLLDGARQPVDLVDEQHVALVELGEDGGEVAGPLQRRART